MLSGPWINKKNFLFYVSMCQKKRIRGQYPANVDVDAAKGPIGQQLKGSLCLSDNYKLLDSSFNVPCKWVQIKRNWILDQEALRALFHSSCYYSL